MTLKREQADFWSLVDKSGDCWLWLGGKSGGYGVRTHEGRSQRAHRVAFLLTHGVIPRGMLVCHRCDNPPCVRPDHLFLGTADDNNKDRAAKGRSKGIFQSDDEHPARKRSGEKHWCAKLSAADVALIRERRESGASTIELGAQFGVNPATISRIARGVWRKEVSL